MTPIIILCGQAGVGKDTLGTYLSYNHGATCIALADPIKRICQYIFEFTDEQLWGPSKFRGEVDESLSGDHNQEKLCSLLRIKLDELFYKSEKLGCIILGERGNFHRLREWALNCRTKAKEGLTPRYCLQTLGTECGRAIDPNLWVNIALDTATKLLENPKLTYTPSKGIQVTAKEKREWKTGGVVLTDGRFRNEILEVKKIGGVAVDIRRSGLPQTPKTHQSETELVDIPLHWFDYVIFNNFDIRELKVKADALISKVWHRGELL